MKTFVIGDSHGACKALLQCFERSGFDYEKDKLICLGDVADSWPEVPEIIEELRKVKNLVMIMGNHDQWLADWLEFGTQNIAWTTQGGRASIEAYLERRPELMIEHREWFKKAVYRYVDEKNRLFVHGGLVSGKRFEEHTSDDFMWSRDLWYKRGESDQKRRNAQMFHEIYVGHTTVTAISCIPIQSGNVWFMDTGAGWEWKLSMMDIDTKEIFQSDDVNTLYPDHKGRANAVIY